MWDPIVLVLIIAYLLTLLYNFSVYIFYFKMAASIGSYFKNIKLQYFQK